jgi:hypothetical protein
MIGTSVVKQQHRFERMNTIFEASSSNIEAFFDVIPPTKNFGANS